MQFIKSLVLLIVAFVALSFAADANVYKSFSVQDTTNSCSFELGAVAAAGNCASNDKCGANKDTKLAYQITQTEANANTENYLISAYAADVCTGTAAGSLEFVCSADKEVEVKIPSATDSTVTLADVKVTCSTKDESSDSGASSVVIGFGALVAVATAALL